MIKKLPKPVLSVNYRGILESLGNQIDVNLSANTKFVYIRIPKGNGTSKDMANNVKRQIELLYLHRDRVCDSYSVWQKQQWEDLK
jgi:hypothetical protein